MGELRFVVRPLTAAGLDGAFRVHISPEALEKLGLKVGEICQITDEDGASGLGIAWRAADRMGNSPKVQPAKMSDTLRETFGFKQGTQITIAKSDRKVTRAQKVSLMDVTPSDYDGTDDGSWITRCRHMLGESTHEIPSTLRGGVDSYTLNQTSRRRILTLIQQIIWTHSQSV